MAGRTQAQLRRILTMIDIMAGFRFPKTTQEILDHLPENLKCSHRTVQRDLWLLESMGFVVVGARSHSRGPHLHTFKLNLLTPPSNSKSDLPWSGR